MGLTIKKISIEDYLSKDVLYTKTIRGNLRFKVVTHHLKGGEILQLYFYRDHPRVEEFVAINEQRHHLTEQKSRVVAEAAQLRLWLDEQSVMLNAITPYTIDITEYNFNQSLQDFEKGKVAILMEFKFAQPNDNTKAINELKSLFNTEEENERTT